MAKNKAHIEAWTLDQLTKSVFFQRKLQEWKLLEVSNEIEQVHGEFLTWNDLNITELGWNKVIHRGIKPVIVFAHPFVLKTVGSSTAYYRMLAMVSQKSMKQVGFNLDAYETGRRLPDDTHALAIAQHFNKIISVLIETSENLNEREFDLWRGMAAGAQAQGSWQNNKGSVAEIVIKELIFKRFREQGIEIDEKDTRVELNDGRVLIFSSEPDIAIYRDQLPVAAVEVKGGIDQAGVLERIGAALKSLNRIRQENPEAVTMLIMQNVSMSRRAFEDLNISTEIIQHLFNAEMLIEDITLREQFFTRLGI